MESPMYIFTNLSMVFKFYVKLSKSQISCSATEQVLISASPLIITSKLSLQSSIILFS